jgi:hypothetical protein
MHDDLKSLPPTVCTTKGRGFVAGPARADAKFKI